jgi:hypothetical protein
MKKLIYFLAVLFLTSYTFASYLQYKNNCNKRVSCSNEVPYKKAVNSTSKGHTYISLMYSNKHDEDYVANYGIYNINSNEFKHLYSHKKHGYSDFAIDTKNNILYYSDLIDKRYNIFRANLNSKDLNYLKMLNVNGDIFNLYKNKIVFRSFDKVNQRHSIGIYDLINDKVKLWNNEDKDSTIYNFCCNTFNSRIYTIELSLTEMHTKRFPNIPKHRIIQYNEYGIKEKEVYSSDKFMNNISVNSDGNKVLFDATNIEDNKPINKIYMIDLNSLKEIIMIESKGKFEEYPLTRMKMPQFSPDGKGFYFLGSMSTSKIIEHPEGTIPVTVNSIYYYDFSTKNIVKIFEVPNAFINIYKIEQ